MNEPTVVVGDGWLGRAIDRAVPGSIHMSQRRFEPSSVPAGAAIIVASGWSSLPRAERDERVASELSDVARLLDVARERDSRIVVVGSSDVCGLAELVDGSTPVNPVTAYGELKARREELVVEAARDGVDAVAVRLAPTHGPGKAQTVRMVSIASQPIIPLARGGRYSVGFVTLADAVSAFLSLGTERSADVVSVGAGPTELRSLLAAIAAHRDRQPRYVPVPLPTSVARRMATSLNDRLAWIGRFSMPRSVAMEAQIEPMGLPATAAYIGTEAPEDTTEPTSTET